MSTLDSRYSRRCVIAGTLSRWLATNGNQWVTLVEVRLRYAWDETYSLAVVDDNDLPYRSIPLSAPGAPYSAEDIDTFIVALPEKIFYPADAVDRLAPALFKLGAVIGLPPETDTILRYFITTGSAFRRFVRKQESEYDVKLVEAVMTLPFAQFVWVVEFATQVQWDTRLVAARAVDRRDCEPQGHHASVAVP